MARTWRAAVEQVYAEIEAAPSAVPAPDVIRHLHDAGDPNLLSVIALLSACRTAVYPQLPPDGVPDGAAAIKAMLARLAGASIGPIPEVEALIRRARAAPAGGDAAASALRCLGEAIRYVMSPSAAELAAVVQAMIAAQAEDPRQPRAMRHQMIGWMDDVVGRAGRIALPEALTLLVRTLDGSLPLLPPFRFEGTGDDAGDLLVWVADPRNRRLLLPVLRIAEPRLVGRDLQVRVKVDPDRIRDRFRIGYLFEHEIHRMFLDACWTMRYDTINYACDATGDRWQVPA